MSASGRGTSGRLIVAALLLVTSAACGRGVSQRSPHEAGEALVGPAGDASYLTARDVWMSMADEPLYHMTRARDLVDHGDDKAAVRELDKSASFFRWGRLYAVGAEQQSAFVNIAQRLEAVARSIRGGAEPAPGILDAIVADGCEALAQHQLGLALDQWRAGEHVRVALLMSAVADELQSGIALSDEAVEGSIESALESARDVAGRLGTEDAPTEAEVREALKGLSGVATRLAQIRSSRSPSEDVTPW